MEARLAFLFLVISINGKFQLGLHGAGELTMTIISQRSSRQRISIIGSSQPLGYALALANKGIST
jgi:hypothetical protein